MRSLPILLRERLEGGHEDDPRACVMLASPTGIPAT
jgi:hypothetical protein